MNDILIVEDDPIFLEALAETIKLAGHSYQTARDGRGALRLLENLNPSIVLSDIRMEKINGQQLLAEIQRIKPGVPVILMTAHGSIEDAVSAMRNGAIDYIQKPFSAKALIEKLNYYIKPLFDEEGSKPVAQDPKSQALLSMALRVAQSDVGVMISGESGTGKEVLAHFIHDHSPRKNNPFIAINCAAIPDQMLEATLFGYEKGAFTGAYKSTPGKFELANKGTLLLDEVTEMSLGLQAKLLRVIQEKEVERIGANKLLQLDVRLLATSNKKLIDEVKAGRFREDLYYRLNIFPLHWLPLRERIYDIVPLANYLIHRHCQNHSPILPVLSEEAKQALLDYSWPGNARELDNVIQRALVLQHNGIIDIHHLHLPTTIESEGEINNEENTAHTLQQHEFKLIFQTLTKLDGNRQQVASKLGISERTLRYKLVKMREEGYLV